MVVCKFFQQGYCRFGQNCRFEHVYGSKYSYHANAPVQAPPAAQVNTVTDEMLIKQVQTDLQGVLKGGQWILSCYSPYKEKPTFPGINDLSAEEARLFFYEAKATNNLEQAVAYMNNLTKEARNKYEQLLQPNMAIIKVLRSLYIGEETSSPFTTNMSQQQNSNNAISVFRSAVQNTSGFNQNTTPSIFNQNQKNVFETQNPSAAKSIFSQAAQSVFSQNQSPNNMFMNAEENTPPAKSIFAQASQNIFGQTALPQSNASSIFAQASQTVFGQNDQTSPFSNNMEVPQNVFQKPETQNISEVTNVFQKQSADNIGVYSKMEELNADDLEDFRRESFRLGFVPEIPPPHSLCN